MQSEQCSVPPKVPSLQILVLDEVKCKTHTQQSTSSTSEAETVNLTENAQSDTFKAPCCCFEYAPYTVLTIV